MIIPFLLCSALIGRAQQPSPPPDFSAGFKQLAALGMPALDAKAIWSVVPEAANSNYELRELAKSVKGNAWLLPAAEDKPRAIALGGIDVIELKSAKKRPTEPDLTKDVEAIAAGLKKLAAKMGAEDRFSFRSGGSNFGSYLLFAAQLHQTGHPALANQLALAVFEVFPSREAAVDAAVDVLAEHAYQEACRAFFTSYDWAAYHTALAAISKRFPRGWSNHDAVGIFLPQLEKQAAGAKAPAPTLPDIPIDPRALAIIAELTEKPPVDPNHPNAKDKNPRAVSAAMRYRMQMGEGYDGDPSGPSSLWLISEPPAAADAEAKASPLARLAALKMAAIPALAALAADPFLTRLPNSRSAYGYSGYFSPDESSDDASLRLYASLNRPATRGEIATQLLAATLPEAEDERGQTPDPDAIRETALAFWKDHKDATREELAAIFLREGSKSQSSLAASILAASKDPKAHQVFEAHVLAADPAIASFRDVQTYLRARKGAARPFFDAYAKLVRSQGGAGDSDDSNEFAWAVKQAGGAEKILKQLEALVGGQSPRALAVQIAKGKPADAKAAIRSLSSMLEDATPTKHLHALLEGANAATDATIRARFLTATFYIRGYNEREGEAGEETDKESDKDTLPADREVSEPEAKVWQKLVADTRELPKEFGRAIGPDDTKPTVASVAALAFENSVSPAKVRAVYEASLVLNKPFLTIIIEQASARLAGKPAAPLPDPSKVSKERLTEIVAAAGKKTAAEIHPYLASLTPDERAAWQKGFLHPEDLAIPDSVKELQFTIIARSADRRLGLPDVKGTGNLDVGFRITADSLTKHIASLAPDIDKHSRSLIFIGPADFGPGLQITASVVPLPAPKAKAKPTPDDSDDDEGSGMIGVRVFSGAIRTLEANESASAIAIVALSGEESGSRSNATWLIHDGKATLEPPSVKDDDVKDPLAAALKSMLESKDLQHFQLQIQLLSRADAEKIKAASEQRDSSNDSDPSEEVLPPPEE